MNLLNITIWSDNDKFVSAVLNNKGDGEFFDNETQFYEKLLEVIKHHQSIHNAIRGSYEKRVSTHFYK